MEKILLILILLFIAQDVFAQHKFGDIKVNTFQEIFNPDNTDLWGKKKMGGAYKFKDENSDIWMENQLSGLIVDNKYVKQNSANFVAELKYEQSALVDKLINQLNEQFGEYEEVEYNAPMVMGTGGKTNMLKWTYKENGKLYEILLGKLGQFTSLNIRQLEAIPDF